MSLDAVSTHHFYFVDQSQTAHDPRLSAHVNEETYLSTAAKVGFISVGVIAALASFLVGGHLIGISIALLSGTAAVHLFRHHIGNHRHEHLPDVRYVPTTPWYQRVLDFFPSPSAMYDRYSQPVRALWRDPRGGDIHAHIPVGRGHIPPYIPVNERRRDVSPPRHGRAEHLHPLGSPGHHVPVNEGRRDMPFAGARRNEPIRPPVPSGPGGHVPVNEGRRHRW